MTKKSELTQFDERLAALGTGFEEVTTDQTKLPAMGIIQGMSPQLKPKHEAYIKGATVGQFANFTTKESFDSFEGVVIGSQLVFEEKSVPSSQGEQPEFIRTHYLDGQSKEQFLADKMKHENTYLTAEGNQLTEVVRLFIARKLPDGGATLEIFSNRKTILDSYRTFNTQAMSRIKEGKPIPRFLQLYKFSTAEKTHRNNNSSYVWSATFLGNVTEGDPEFLQAVIGFRTLFNQLQAQGAGSYEVASPENKAQAADIIADMA